jgi:hypothetical protein
MSDDRLAQKAAWEAALTAAFRARRCNICGAPAVSVAPGSDDIPDRNFCLEHAMPVKTVITAQPVGRRRKP